MRALDPDVAAVRPHVDELGWVARQQEVVAVTARLCAFDDESAAFADVQTGFEIPRPSGSVRDDLFLLVERVDRPGVTVFLETRLPYVRQGHADSIFQVPVVWYQALCYVNEADRSECVVIKTAEVDERAAQADRKAGNPNKNASSK